MTPQQASEKYHWCKYDAATNTVELYLDHFMLSNARMCEAKFYFEHMLLIKPRYGVGRKPWFLDFGEFLHSCFEEFYNSFKTTQKAPPVELWLEKCKEKWLFMDMEWYASSTNERDVTVYEEVGGWEGVAGLLIQYFAYYMDMRVRVIDTEITFGHNKEVFLGEFFLDTTFIHNINEGHSTEGDYRIVKCYLTGRIDLLADNGYKIGPVDHKHTHSFRGDEHDKFNPHDGITGYILAVNELLKRYRESGLTSLPMSSGGWIYHISAKTPSVNRTTKVRGPRFKCTPVDKTQEQLDDFKLRQLSTFKRIAELLFNNKIPEWNTLVCDNIFMRKCEYKPIHQQPASHWTHIINDHYEVGKSWDTREHSKERSE